MICPYCNNKMTDGELVGDRYSNHWENKDLNKEPRIIRLKRKGKGLFSSVRNEAFLCRECNKIIIDLNTEEKQ